MSDLRKVIKGTGEVASAIGSSIALSHLFSKNGLKDSTLKVGKVTYLAGAALQVAALFMPDDKKEITEEQAEKMAADIADDIKKDLSDSEELKAGTKSAVDACKDAYECLDEDN